MSQNFDNALERARKNRSYINDILAYKSLYDFSQEFITRNSSNKYVLMYKRALEGINLVTLADDYDLNMSEVIVLLKNTSLRIKSEFIKSENIDSILQLNLSCKVNNCLVWNGIVSISMLVNYMKEHSSLKHIRGIGVVAESEIISRLYELNYLK